MIKLDMPLVLDWVAYYRLLTFNSLSSLIKLSLYYSIKETTQFIMVGPHHISLLDDIDQLGFA